MSQESAMHEEIEDLRAENADLRAKLEAAERERDTLRKQLSQWDKPTLSTFVNFQDNLVNDVVVNLQDGRISRKKALECLARIAHGATALHMVPAQEPKVSDDCILVDEIARLREQLDAERLKVSQMEPVAAFGHQCIQDQCENAYVEQTVHKQLREQRDALAAALRGVRHMVKGCQGLRMDEEWEQLAENLSRILDVIDDAPNFAAILAERDRDVRRTALERAANLVENAVFELAPGNTIRCGFKWAEEIRKLKEASCTSK